MDVTVTLNPQEILAEVTPENPTKTLYGVSWEDYVQFVNDTLGETNLRTSYNRGVFKIMGNAFTHENLSRFLHDLVRLTSLILRIRVISAGSMSLISDRVRKGVDPDESFYIENARRANFKDKLYDDETDVPPDLVVEIDRTHKTDDKFEIYAAFGIKEFWLYDGEFLRILLLSKTGEYLSAEKSSALPVLSAEILSEFLRRSQREDQFEVLQDFEKWLTEQKNK